MPNAAALVPANMVFDAHGIARSRLFDDVYHSADGADAQARHVFLGGNRLPQRWRGRRSFTIVETGFGFGVNFLAIRQALRTDPDAPARLHYIATEKHPLQRNELASFHRSIDPDRARDLIERWPPRVAGFHRIELDGGRVVLSLLFGDARELLAELDAQVDAFFLDGFAPEKNPDMWSEALFRELGRLSRSGTTAATWTVAAAVRSRLALIGFRTEKQPGFGHKREMLAAEKVADPVPEPGLPSSGEKHAVIVGAGLAGTWCAHALARRGWQIDLIEREQGPAQVASAIPVGALRPALNLADNDNARLARAGFLLSARQHAAYPELASCWAQTGVLHVATDDAQVSRMQRIVAEHAFPEDYVGCVDTYGASTLAGRPVARPAWWIPLGGWVSPNGLCTALLRLHPRNIRSLFGNEAADLKHENGAWRVLGRDGRELARAPHVVLANAHEARRLAALPVPAFVCVRGQVSHLPPSASRRLEIVVCGDGYVAPWPGGGHCVGASFHPDDTGTELRSRDHAENLARLERMLPGFGSELDPCRIGGCAGVRTATADRLPACGGVHADAPEIAGLAGLHLIAGLGARGLVFAPLCAELLAATLAGEPNPIERRLATAMAPSRFHTRARHDAP